MKFNNFRPQDRPQNDPRRTQDGSKRVPKAIIFHVDFLLQFWTVLGSILGPFWPPKSTPNPRQKSIKIKLRQHTSTRPFQEAPRAPQEASRSPQEAPKTLPDSLKGSKSPSGGSPRSPQDPPNSHLFQVCSKITALT